MTSSGTSHGPRRRPREATSTTPCRSGTTIGPNSARTGAVHRSSAQSRPTGPRAVRAHPSPAGTAATGATHHDRHARTTCQTSSAPRSCRRCSVLLPAYSRGGRPPCKQHERLVSPSPRPAASSTTSTSIPSASTAHRGVAVSSRHRQERRPCAWPKFRRRRELREPFLSGCLSPVFLCPPGPRQGCSCT